MNHKNMPCIYAVMRVVAEIKFIALLKAAKPVILQGEIVGLNEDGSLQLKTSSEGQTTKIYTGTIRII